MAEIPKEEGQGGAEGRVPDEPIAVRAGSAGSATASGPDPAYAGSDSGPDVTDPVAEPSPGPARSRGGLATFLAILALTGIAMIGAAAWLAWQQLEGSESETVARLDSVQAAVERLASEVEAMSTTVGENRALREQVEQALRELEQSRSALIETARGEATAVLEEARATLADVHAIREDLQASFRRAAAPAVEPVDVERLMLMAKDALAFQRDADTALEALRIADARLRALADPAYAEARRRLATEMLALQEVPRPDVQGAAFTLSGLQEQLSSLATRGGPAITGPGANGAPASVNGEPSWRAFLDDLWGSLRSLVVIRRTGDDEGPLLAPEQGVYLVQNLFMKLESARAALLSGDSANYHLSLQTAREWLESRFDTGSAAVARVIERIDELDRIDMEPALPDISGSLAALRAAIERQRQARDAATPSGQAPEVVPEATPEATSGGGAAPEGNGPRQ